MIVGLTGRKGCGKSSVAKILNQSFGYTIASFASPIKDMLRVLGLGDAELNDPTIKEIPLDEYNGKSPRELMQILGTEFGRELIDPRIWVTALEKRLDFGTSYVIDDVRFPNEAAMIHANGGVVIKVYRPTQEESAKDPHSSESGLDSEQIDYELRNSSCFYTDLEHAVKNLFKELNYNGTFHDTEFISQLSNSK